MKNNFTINKFETHFKFLTFAFLIFLIQSCSVTSRVYDQDNDGVPDDSDLCVEYPGPIENNGCPWPDSDGDGIIDKEDKCPRVAGIRKNQGCPKIK